MVWPIVAAAAPAVIGAAADVVGGYLSGERAEKASKKAYKRALEFAQNGIQWKVADANAAGINPYYALGAPTASYTDSGIGASGGIGEGLSNAGQSISRAALAMSPAPDKVAAAMAPLALERAGLENDYLRAKIAAEMRLISQPGSPMGVNALPPGASRSSQFGNIPTRDIAQGQKAEDWAGDFLGSIIASVGALEDFGRANAYGPGPSWMRSGSYTRRSPYRSSGGGGW